MVWPQNVKADGDKSFKKRKGDSGRFPKKGLERMVRGLLKHFSQIQFLYGFADKCHKYQILVRRRVFNAVTLAIRAVGSLTRSQGEHLLAVVIIESLTLKNVVALSIAMMLMIADRASWRNGNLSIHIVGIQLTSTQNMLYSNLALAICFVLCFDLSRKDYKRCS